MADKPKVSTPQLVLGVFFCVVVAVVGPLLLAKSSPWNLLLELAALVLAVLVIGSIIVKLPLGILITNHNTMSLSRFQAVLWTLIVLAAYMTIVLGRIATSSAGDISSKLLGLEITTPLLALMGISYASAIGSSIATSAKTQKTTDPATIDAAQKNADEGVQVSADGVVFENAQPKDASFVDIFQGDELADAHLVDLSKVQMFFFTIVAAALFLSDVFRQLSQATDLTKVTLPVLPETLITLMGISHAAYLGNKTVTRTPAHAPVQAEIPAKPAPPPPPPDEMLHAKDQTQRLPQGAG